MLYVLSGREGFVTLTFPVEIKAFPFNFTDGQAAN